MEDVQKARASSKKNNAEEKLAELREFAPEIESEFTELETQLTTINEKFEAEAYEEVETLAGAVLDRCYELKSAKEKELASTALEEVKAALAELGESELDKVSDACSNRNSLIDGFATLISSIRGQKQERMKIAVNSMGLVKVLHRWLHYTFPYRRMRACYLLGLMKSRSSAGELSQILSDINPAVVSAAIIALGEIRDSQAVPELVSHFSSFHSLPAGKRFNA